MSNLLVLPILIPLGTAIVLMLLRDSPRLQRFIGVVGAGALLAASLAILQRANVDGIQVLHVGAWPAPFGIVLVADLLGAIMVVLTGLMGFATAVYSLATVDANRERFGYYPLLHVLLMGVSGAFLTGDLFNMYVWFEVLLIASFVLLALGNERGQLEGAVKYVVLNLISSAFFLAGLGLLYGMLGTLNMADMAVKIAEADAPGVITTVSMLFLVAFGIKAAVFPLFFWLPASYHTPPVAVSALFAGLLTKVGVYALIRVFTLLFVTDVPFTHGIILAVSALTMITGVLGAAAQYEFRRILSFHIVSQIGYMIMGLALFTPLALAGSVFYIAHHIIVKTNLFLVAGIAERLQGSYQLKELGNLYRDYPWLAILFLVPAFSLAGMPPLSGFWGKLFLVKAGLDVQSYAIVAVALVVGVLTLYSMTKIWAEAFWAPRPEERDGVTGARPQRTGLWALVIPVAVLAAITLAIGLTVAPLLDVSIRAAEQLLDPTAYTTAVLGGEAA